MRILTCAIALAILAGTARADNFTGLYTFNPEPPKPVQADPPPGLPAAPGGINPLLLSGIPSLNGALPALGADLPDDLGSLPAAPPPLPPAAVGGGPGALLRASANDLCIRAIAAAERRYQIPQNLLIAIGLQEAGIRKDGRVTIWPWSVNSHGAGYTFDSQAEAIEFVNREKAAGRESIDTGCLQINQRWHPEAFASLEQAMDPAINADYGARYLVSLHKESGDWMTAAGNYHSRTPEHHNRYLAGVRDNMAVANEAFGNAHSVPAGDGFDIVVADLLGQNANNDYQDTELADVGFGWGSQDAAGEDVTMSIYSARPLQPVISNLASFPGQ